MGFREGFGKGFKLPDYLTEDEIILLFRVVRSFENAVMMLVLWLTGIRAAECMGLRWEHILWDQDAIFIKEGKGKKDRIVPMIPLLMSNLHRLQILEKRYKGPIFQFSKRTMNRRIEKIGIWARIKRSVHPHQFRHTIAVMLVRVGCPLNIVQAVLGHSNIQTTGVYAKIAMNEAIDFMVNWEV